MRQPTGRAVDQRSDRAGGPIDGPPRHNGAHTDGCRRSRPVEVVGLVALGLSNEDIAERLVLSPLTAKTHVNRAMMKLDARDRAQLVVIAYQTGLVRPGSPAWE